MINQLLHNAPEFHINIYYLKYSVIKNPYINLRTNYTKCQFTGILTNFLTRFTM